MFRPNVNCVVRDIAFISLQFYHCREEKQSINRKRRVVCFVVYYASTSRDYCTVDDFDLWDQIVNKGQIRRRGKRPQNITIESQEIVW